MGKDLDEAWARLVSARLHEGPAPRPAVLAAIMQEAAHVAARRRRARRWWAGVAMAASLAICAGVAFTLARAPVAEDGVAAAIDLLADADGTQLVAATSASVSERLLAWQDAPYEAACLE